MTEASAADLAVVIVNYETGAWLERCLRSLEGARGDVSVDVVVIDNASGDGSADVSESLGARLIRNDTNRYLSPAWNQGAAVTQAPYLLFLNPDTEWFHGTLADLVGAAQRHMALPTGRRRRRRARRRSRRGRADARPRRACSARDARQRRAAANWLWWSIHQRRRRA
jgi:GT2 family glycosyltransferase